MTPTVLTVDDVATLLKCSDKTVRARAAELGGLKFGVDWVFPGEAFNRRLVELALQTPAKPAGGPTPAAVLVQPPAAPAKARRAPPPALPTLHLLQSAQSGS